MNDLEMRLWGALAEDPQAVSPLADLMEEGDKPRLAAALRQVDWAAARSYLGGWGDMWTVLVQVVGRDPAAPAVMAELAALGVPLPKSERFSPDWLFDGIDWAGVARLAHFPQAAAALVVGGSEAWTRASARATKGYDARVAERHIGRQGVVIVSHAAPTRVGFRITPSGPVTYYRKSVPHRKVSIRSVMVDLDRIPWPAVRAVARNILEP